MTITLKPQIEAKLLEKAQREGQDPDALANDALMKFLEGDGTESVKSETASTIQAEQPGEDPRLATLREIEARSQFMNPKPSERDFLREGRAGAMFERHLDK